jgi:hypothetical protein
MSGLLYGPPLSPVGLMEYECTVAFVLLGLDNIFCLLMGECRFVFVVIHNDNISSSLCSMGMVLLGLARVCLGFPKHTSSFRPVCRLRTDAELHSSLVITIMFSLSFCTMGLSSAGSQHVYRLRTNASLHLFVSVMACLPPSFHTMGLLS